ncbi:carboxymuconolactone decarboxylase family protein, partial [Armatimonas sp.]|uniref:carboxymuconolactone decarboxylase family protein n=1 Tax=Armatimonas sp. TaxID=1872638 RepID=UPI0034D96D53
MSSHGGFLRSQGQDLSDVDAVGTGDLTKAKGLAPKERELLGFVKRLTLEPAKVSDIDVEALRKVGWTDEQIFEATFDTALFAFFNRMA